MATPERSKSIQAFTTEAESSLRANGVSTRCEIVAGGLKIFQTLPPLVGADLQKDAACNCRPATQTLSQIQGKLTQIVLGVMQCKSTTKQYVNLILNPFMQLLLKNIKRVPWLSCLLSSQWDVSSWVRLNALQTVTRCTPKFWSGQVSTPKKWSEQPSTPKKWSEQPFTPKKWSEQLSTPNKLEWAVVHSKILTFLEWNVVYSNFFGVEFECTLNSLEWTLGALQNFWSVLEVHSKTFGVEFSCTPNFWGEL